MFNNFDQQIVDALFTKGRWQMYLNGLGVTLTIAIGAIILGVFIGMLVAMVKVAAAGGREKPGILLKMAGRICDIYLTIIRGTPVVVQLLICYAVIFAAAPNSMSWLVAIFAFGINSGAYVAEIIRAGIMAVNRGQMEAGRSLGLPYSKTMLAIILPQAVKNILPALGNELIVLVKETAVVGYIAVRDLTKEANLVASAIFQPVVPLFVAALLYLILVMLMTWGLRTFERRLARSDYR